MHLPLEAIVQRMALGIGRMAQRPDIEAVPCLLQGHQFLRDERLGQARPAFDQHRQLGGFASSSGGALLFRAQQRVYAMGDVA